MYCVRNLFILSHLALSTSCKVGIVICIILMRKLMSRDYKDLAKST